MGAVASRPAGKEHNTSHGEQHNNPAWTTNRTKTNRSPSEENPQVVRTLPTTQVTQNKITDLGRRNNLISKTGEWAKTCYLAAQCPVSDDPGG